MVINVRPSLKALEKFLGVLPNSATLRLPSSIFLSLISDSHFSVPNEISVSGSTNEEPVLSAATNAAIEDHLHLVAGAAIIIVR